MWRYVFSSVAGTSHARSSLPVQDTCRAELLIDARRAEVLVAVTSDGAGTASHGQAGSKLACDLFIDAVRDHFASGGDGAGLSGGFIENWIAGYQQSITAKLSGSDLVIQDFACTLVAAVVERERAVYFQIGDGAIVVSDRISGPRSGPRSSPDGKDRYDCICWPQRGEYANTTHFLTDADAAQKIFGQLKIGAIDEIALFTDGIQGLVLDYRTQSPHAPFFAPLFAWLRQRQNGYSQELSETLSAYLNSDKINARTDDDKTLILATRRRD